jgi:hypothetical protein
VLRHRFQKKPHANQKWEIAVALTTVGGIQITFVPKAVAALAANATTATYAIFRAVSIAIGGIYECVTRSQRTTTLPQEKARVGY